MNQKIKYIFFGGLLALFSCEKEANFDVNSLYVYDHSEIRNEGVYVKQGDGAWLKIGNGQGTPNFIFSETKARLEDLVTTSPIVVQFLELQFKVFDVIIKFREEQNTLDNEVKFSFDRTFLTVDGDSNTFKFSDDYENIEACFELFWYTFKNPNGNIGQRQYLGKCEFDTQIETINNLSQMANLKTNDTIAIMSLHQILKKQ